MKKYIIVIVLIVGIAGICGLNLLSNYAWTRSETDGFRSMKVKVGTLSNSGCTVIIENEENKTFPLGIEFWHIEKLENGEWKDVPFLSDGRWSHLIAYQVYSGDCQEHEIRWDYEVGRLSSGKYRIAVPIYKSTGSGIDDYLYARFIIK